MKLKDYFALLWSNVLLKRESEQVVDRKTYYLTNAFIAFCIGFVIGLFTLVGSGIGHEKMELALNIIFPVVLALGVAFNIYYLIPLFRSADVELWIKIVRPILGIVLFAAILLVGVYAFIGLLIILFVYIFFQLIWMYAFKK